MQQYFVKNQGPYLSPGAGLEHMCSLHCTQVAASYLNTLCLQFKASEAFLDTEVEYGVNGGRFWRKTYVHTSEEDYNPGKPDLEADKQQIDTDNIYLCSRKYDIKRKVTSFCHVVSD